MDSSLPSDAAVSRRPTLDRRPGLARPTLPAAPLPATRDAIDPAEQWLALAAQAPDAYTALHYAQAAAELRPGDRRVEAAVQRAMLKGLSQDAFLAYMAENERAYVVAFRNSH